MRTIPKGLLHDIGAPAFNPYAEYEEEERLIKAAHESIRWLVRNALENNPNDHRTGCATEILRTIADVLIEEKGWTHRQASEAMVMEGVRCGGYLERDGSALARKAWEARQLTKEKAS